MRLFGDTSAWFAAWNKQELERDLARRAIESFTHQRAKVYITDYIFDETVTLVMSRSGQTTAVEAGKWLLNSSLVQFVRINREQWNEAWQLFQQYDDKEFSFTDCTSFVVMREHHLVDAFTFDKHFEQMGFRMWPK